MSSPDFGRRIDQQAEDLRAIADTVLDIKETVDGHTQALAEQSALLGDHSEILAGHSVDLGEIKASVAEILALLRQR